MLCVGDAPATVTAMSNSKVTSHNITLTDSEDEIPPVPSSPDHSVKRHYVMQLRMTLRLNLCCH